MKSKSLARSQQTQCIVDAYLLLHVVQGIRGVDGEADEDDVRIRVRERTEAVVVFLASGIPQSEFDMLSVHLDIGNVVLEDGGDIDLLARVVSDAIG